MKPRIVVLASALLLFSALPLYGATQEKPAEPKTEPKTATEPQNSGTKITVNVNTASANVTVLTDKNAVVLEPKLTKENFRVYDCKDAKKKKGCVEQEITHFSSVDAPITAVLVYDYSKTIFALSCLGDYDPNSCYYTSTTGPLRQAPEEFLQRLKPEDWVAFAWFDMQTHIETDFTQDKRELVTALEHLLMMRPSSRESNVYNALAEVMDRVESAQSENREQMDRVAIVLIATGYDSFSKITFDKMLKRVKNTPVVIYTVRIGKTFQNRFDGSMDAETNLTLLQAKSFMETLASLTGGKAYEPVFEGQYRDIFEEITAMLRAQYTIGWQIKPEGLDGKYHEIFIDVLGDFVDQKTGRPIKLKAVHRQGYIAEKTK